MKPDNKTQNIIDADSTRSPGTSEQKNILIWLPSPLGDAILSTPTLRALRSHFKSCKIFFYSNDIVRHVLSPAIFNDEWIPQQSKNPFVIAKKLREYQFTHAILFKNSIASALACFLAGIPSRIGYTREGRGLLLTDKLYPPKLPDGKFKPTPIVDYYLAIASWLGIDTTDKKLELPIEPAMNENLPAKFPELLKSDGPVIILVPGGAFGPSKCWPSDRFAQTADRLISNYSATVIISVAPTREEKQISREICNNSKNKLINLGERSLTLGELKALFSCADLVITNDTGPRHIAIAFKRKVVTLFGPNDPVWTDTGYENEIQIVGKAPCVPCRKPNCKQPDHLCMNSISVEAVCEAADRLIEKDVRLSKSANNQKFIEVSKSFFVDADFQQSLAKSGLNSIESVFAFEAAENLSKDNLASFRSRHKFAIETPGSLFPTTVFLKRYERPPFLFQLRKLLSTHSIASCGRQEFETARELHKSGVNTPLTIAYGGQKGIFFEKRSFIITEKIPHAESLERKLPGYFDGPAASKNIKRRREFIRQLAEFIKKFHATNYRHRDLYLAHVFHDIRGKFYLIDLARAFKPLLTKSRYTIKDIAQLNYSAPSKHFSRTDRIRFYKGYSGSGKLTETDKKFIRKVMKKTIRIARHDLKHGREVPCAGIIDFG